MTTTKLTINKDQGQATDLSMLHRLAACHYWIEYAECLTVKLGGDFLKALSRELDRMVTLLIATHGSIVKFEHLDGYMQPIRVGKETYACKLHCKYDLLNQGHEFKLVCQLANGQEYIAYKLLTETALQALGVP